MTSCLVGAQEIDLEAIAFHLGARVRYRKLEGCEARIIGCIDAAIITIDEDCSYRRKRFSLAHEIGHWTHHKGQTLVCRVEESRRPSIASPFASLCGPAVGLGHFSDNIYFVDVSAWSRPYA